MARKKAQKNLDRVLDAVFTTTEHQFSGGRGPQFLTGPQIAYVILYS